MHLADAAEVRVLQQVAANSKLSTPVTDRASHRATSTTAGRRYSTVYHTLSLRLWHLTVIVSSLLGIEFTILIE